MLNVQKYLRSGKTLSDLTAEYNIGCNVQEEMGVVSLNYSQIASDMSQLICQECRGLILELDTWDVVCQSFSKFWNLEEPLAAPVREVFDWSTAKVYQKIDGTLIMGFWYKGEWHFATRKMADAAGPVGSYDMTFADLIATTMKEMDFQILDLNPGYFYAFELTTPLNRIVVPYDDYKLTLLAMRNKFTLEEVDIESPAFSGNIPKVRLLPLSNLDEIMEMIGELSPTEGEGVVVVDGEWRRLKIKSPEYLKAFRAVVHAESSPRNRIEILLSDSYDDIYGLLPQSLKNDMDELKRKFEALSLKVSMDYQLISYIEEQKDFAFEALKFKYSGWLFELRKGKTLEEIIKASQPEKIERLL